MSLRDLFRSSSENGICAPAIDEYLMTHQEENNRATNVNSPSQTGNCNRRNYYVRIGEESDGKIDPRGERIFHNGDAVHDRIQTYLERAGLLLMREVPLRNDKYNIQGHTDGLLQVKRTGEIVVLEIKSINKDGFAVVKQKGVKREHIMQGNVYVYCLEEHRKYLQKKYPDESSFRKSRKVRSKRYSALYQHLQDGRKYTREQKISHKVEEHLKADEILWRTKMPINRISFVYECKDNQEIKEFIVKADAKLMDEILKKFKVLEKAVKERKPPKREGKNRNDVICRYCPFQITCWN